MGLVNFYSKFCINMSDILKPLYDLLKKNVTWEWTDMCDRAFAKIKKVLSSSPVLAHYDPKRALILSVDSSAYGVGAVLTQRDAAGAERLLCAASRTLNSAETNYSQLDKEALAIVFGVTKHHQYLYGRKFTLRSDHRPLSYIFGKNKGIPITAASRLQRYAVKLAAYDFDIEFVSSKNNCFADTLSRLPLKFIDCNLRSEECSYLNFAQDNFPINFKDIKIETAKDSLLSKIYGFILYGWPPKSELNKIELCYSNRKENLHIDQGCIVWGYRIIVPRSLREIVLKEIHDGHPGIIKMKQIARNYVWWDNIDSDIECMARECAACRETRAAPRAAPVHSWPWPSEPWSRIHIDFLGPFNHDYYLILIDAHSKWIEVEKVSTTSARLVINCLRQWFARFGLPKRLISDNGPPFSSSEFANYLQRNGIKHTLIAPYHPSSNGAAENAVRSIKSVLKKAQVDRTDTSVALARFLFSYRNTEQCTTGVEPAVSLLGRRLRGRLDLMRPDTAERVRAAQIVEEQRRPTPLRIAKEGDRIFMRDYSKNNSKWVDGIITDSLSLVSYKVQTSDGRKHKRHIDQLLTRKSRFSLSQAVSEGESNERKEGGGNSVEDDECSLSSQGQQGVDDVEGDGEQRDLAASPKSPVHERIYRKAALRCIRKLKRM
ncbi:uncharacterized protein K02A2.6-like [Colias croceus]|uniref:uncharacterized protein K02A2.6-like n=1 Tax=Colias crocea TaxID=72248 RepID=UPI001E2810CB|nr:uncharacterized protein K02A2.6-like [Colias croceus]